MMFLQFKNGETWHIPADQKYRLTDRGWDNVVNWYKLED